MYKLRNFKILFIKSINKGVVTEGALFMPEFSDVLRMPLVKNNRFRRKHRILEPAL